MEKKTNKHYATLGNLVAEVDKDVKDILTRNNLVNIKVDIREAHILIADHDVNGHVVSKATDMVLKTNDKGEATSIIVYGDRGKLSKGEYFSSLSTDHMVMILSYLEKTYL